VKNSNIGEGVIEDYLSRVGADASLNKDMTAYLREKITRQLQYEKDHLLSRIVAKQKKLHPELDDQQIQVLIEKGYADAGENIVEDINTWTLRRAAGDLSGEDRDAVVMGMVHEREPKAIHELSETDKGMLLKRLSVGEANYNTMADLLNRQATVADNIADRIMPRRFMDKVRESIKDPTSDTGRRLFHFYLHAYAPSVKLIGNKILGNAGVSVHVREATRAMLGNAPKEAQTAEELLAGTDRGGRGVLGLLHRLKGSTRHSESGRELSDLITTHKALLKEADSLATQEAMLTAKQQLGQQKLEIIKVTKGDPTVRGDILAPRKAAAVGDAYRSLDEASASNAQAAQFLREVRETVDGGKDLVRQATRDIEGSKQKLAELDRDIDKLTSRVNTHVRDKGEKLAGLRSYSAYTNKMKALRRQNKAAEDAIAKGLQPEHPVLTPAQMHEQAMETVSRSLKQYQNQLSKVLENARNADGSYLVARIQEGKREGEAMRQLMTRRRRALAGEQVARGASQEPAAEFRQLAATDQLSRATSELKKAKGALSKATHPDTIKKELGGIEQSLKDLHGYTEQVVQPDGTIKDVFVPGRIQKVADQIAQTERAIATEFPEVYQRGWAIYKITAGAFGKAPRASVYTSIQRGDDYVRQIETAITGNDTVKLKKVYADMINAKRRASASGLAIMGMIHGVPDYLKEDTAKRMAAIAALPEPDDGVLHPQLVLSYARALQASEQPVSVIAHIFDGHVSSEEIKVIKEQYPKLYEQWSAQLIKDRRVLDPKQKAAATAFVGKPLSIANKPPMSTTGGESSKIPVKGAKPPSNAKLQVPPTPATSVSK
jgi:urease gamma subunit